MHSQAVQNSLAAGTGGSKPAAPNSPEPWRRTPKRSIDWSASTARPCRNSLATGTGALEASGAELARTLAAHAETLDRLVGVHGEAVQNSLATGTGVLEAGGAELARTLAAHAETLDRLVGVHGEAVQNSLAAGTGALEAGGAELSRTMAGHAETLDQLVNTNSQTMRTALEGVAEEINSRLAAQADRFSHDVAAAIAGIEATLAARGGDLGPGGFRPDRRTAQAARRPRR